MSNKMWELYIVLENGKPAVLKNSKVWNCCVFHAQEDAINYATYWCGRGINREYTLVEWSKGIDVGQSDKCIISIDTIIVPSSSVGF